MNKVAVLPAFHETTEDYLKYSPKIQVESDIFRRLRRVTILPRCLKSGSTGRETGFRIHWKLSIKQNHLMIKDFS